MKPTDAAGYLNSLIKKITIKIFLFMKFLKILSLGNFTRTKVNDCNITETRLDYCNFI